MSEKIEYGFDMTALEYVSYEEAMLRGHIATTHYSVARNQIMHVYGVGKYSEAAVILASRGKVRPASCD